MKIQNVDDINKGDLIAACHCDADGYNCDCEGCLIPVKVECINLPYLMTRDCCLPDRLRILDCRIHRFVPVSREFAALYAKYLYSSEFFGNSEQEIEFCEQCSAKLDATEETHDATLPPEPSRCESCRGTLLTYVKRLDANGELHWACVCQDCNVWTFID